jgi:hypothetical protein
MSSSAVPPSRDVATVAAEGFKVARAAVAAQGDALTTDINSVGEVRGRRSRGPCMSSTCVAVWWA